MLFLEDGTQSRGCCRVRNERVFGEDHGLGMGVRYACPHHVNAGCRSDGVLDRRGGIPVHGLRHKADLRVRPVRYGGCSCRVRQLSLVPTSFGYVGSRGHWRELAGCYLLRGSSRRDGRRQRGPLLLVRRTSVPADTLEVVRDFGITKVYVIGGTGVVSEQVVSQLRAAGVSTFIRIAGKDRYYTSAMIAAEVVRLSGRKSYAYVASGEDFPDALAVTPLAMVQKAPILLTKRSSLPSPIAYELGTRGYYNTYVVGGTGPVSDYVAGQIPNFRRRIAGSDRFETAYKVGDFGFGIGAFNSQYPTGTGIANFRSFADALSGGHACGRLGFPLLGTETASVPASTRRAFPAAEGQFGRPIYVFGGTGVVSSTAFAVLAGLE